MKSLLALSDSSQQERYKNELLNFIVKGNINQQIWAIFLVSEIYQADEKLISQITEKLRSPNSSVRLAAISVLHELKLDTNIKLKLQSWLEKKSKIRSEIKQFWELSKETLFGSGALGITKNEKIQIAGALVCLSESNASLSEFLELQNELDIYWHRYEWAELLIDKNSFLNSADIKLISNLISKIVSDKSKSIDFFAETLFRCKSFHELFEKEIIALLFRDDREGAKVVLQEYQPKILRNSEEFTLLKDSLLGNYFNDANVAYEILSDNNLIEDALFK